MNKILASIGAGATVNEIVAAYPETIEVFNDFAIEACCGGSVPLREAAIRDGADPEEVLRALHELIAEARA